MGEVLSQNEIDSLLKALSSGELDVDEMKDEDKKQVKNYDFARPAKFSKEHLRTLEIIFEHYGRLLSTNLPVYLRKNVQVEVMNSVRNTLENLLDQKYCEKEVLHLLLNCVQAKMNLVFGGEPGAGKTECAKFFMQFIRKEERVITIEDSLEIHYANINPGADAVELRVGKGFDYTDAIKASLRQNPSWLMLSEARSVEVTSLLEQWSTGVHGFTTIHLDDVRKLPDRILNMMNNVNDAQRMENRIYRYVNAAVLIRKIESSDGKVRRYIDQLCFFSREEGKNRIYMIVDDGALVSKELPPDIKKRFRETGVEEPFVCRQFETYLKENR